MVIGGLIAPIFFNTVEDSGGLPIMCDVAKIKTGDLITVNFASKEIWGDKHNKIAEFELKPVVDF